MNGQINKQMYGQLARMKSYRDKLTITWKPLYDWQLKFRTENDLSIKEFISIIEYKNKIISSI
jgi:hypothetical protein